MRSKTKTSAHKPKSKTAGKKLVGYWEERKLAEQIHSKLKEIGSDTSEVLRNAYRSVLDNGHAQSEWTLKEAAIARRIGISKTTLKGMRDRNELVDDLGPIWRRPTKSSAAVLYDVVRTRRFFGVVDEQVTT